MRIPRLRSRNYWLEGLRPYLVSWRLRGTVVWVAYNITFGWKWLWARHVLPGELLVSTASSSAAKALQISIEQLRDRSTPHLCRALQTEDLLATDTMLAARHNGSGQRSRRETSAPIAAAWRVRVRSGTEQAVLREIEYRVGTEMARLGGYERIGRRNLLAVGRAAIAANQARRVCAAAKAEPPGIVAFVPDIHEKYRELLSLSGSPTRRVQVLVLDSAVQIDDLPESLRGHVCTDYSVESPHERPPFGHGAATAAIIADIAENACVTVFPVMRPGGDVYEGSIVNGLAHVWTGHLEADVIVLCLGLEYRHWSRSTKTDRSNMELFFEGIGAQPVIVVSTGNARNRDLVVLEPAARKAVYAIGATNRSGHRSWFSRSQFPDDDRPELYLLAPGGEKWGSGELESPVTIGNRQQIGSSIAAAYAAGAIARALGTVVGADELPPRRKVTEALRRRARALDDNADAGEYCTGIMQQPPTGWHRSASPDPHAEGVAYAASSYGLDDLIDPALRDMDFALLP